MEVEVLPFPPSGVVSRGNLIEPPCWAMRAADWRCESINAGGPPRSGPGLPVCMANLAGRVAWDGLCSGRAPPAAVVPLTPARLNCVQAVAGLRLAGVPVLQERGDEEPRDPAEVVCVLGHYGALHRK